MIKRHIKILDKYVRNKNIKESVDKKIVSGIIRNIVEYNNESIEAELNAYETQDHWW